jgi:Bacterial cellulose synthase subunit.
MNDLQHIDREPNLLRRPRLLLACSLLCLTGLSGGALAEETPAAEPQPAPAAAQDGYQLTFKQLGKDYTMSLRGIESTDTVNFDVRADEVVTGAQLNLQYTYSPALLSDLSQINVLVNDEVAASLPLPKETAGTVQKQTVQIPPYLLTEFNRVGCSSSATTPCSAKTRCIRACGPRSATKAS